MALRAFPDHRFVGAKDTMVVYDTDDPEQRAELERRIEEDDLLNQGLLLAFTPDILPEARNRGFRAARVASQA